MQVDMNNLCLIINWLILFNCYKNTSMDKETFFQGNNPSFKIIRHSDRGFKSTNRKVDVFGIPIYAYKEVEDIKLLHAANIMAQYLDNDEDGIIDNPFCLKRSLRTKQHYLFGKRYLK